jgi:hypothetical protein
MEALRKREKQGETQKNHTPPRPPFECKCTLGTILVKPMAEGFFTACGKTFKGLSISNCFLWHLKGIHQVSHKNDLQTKVGVLYRRMVCM